jgi:tyrosinase
MPLVREKLIYSIRTHQETNMLEMRTPGKEERITFLNQVFAHSRSFLFNIPSEEITFSKKTVERKNQAKMTKDEKERFTSVVDILIDAGTYGPHVAIHGDMSHRMHTGHHGEAGTQRFLPWHRAYLYHLEMMLLAFDPEIFIPYWDWTVDQSIPQWLENFTPTVIVDGEPRRVRRTPGLLWRTLPSLQETNRVLNETSYRPFTLALETGYPRERESSRMHNGVHNWVGGIMSNIQYSPTDVLFWLHHANCDRLWAQWQKDHTNEHPSLKGPDAVLDPWSLSEADTRDMNNLGYVYI